MGALRKTPQGLFRVTGGELSTAPSSSCCYAQLIRCDTNEGVDQWVELGTDPVPTGVFWSGDYCYYFQGGIPCLPEGATLFTPSGENGEYATCSECMEENGGPGDAPCDCPLSMPTTYTISFDFYYQLWIQTGVGTGYWSTVSDCSVSVPVAGGEGFCSWSGLVEEDGCVSGIIRLGLTAPPDEGTPPCGWVVGADWTSPLGVMWSSKRTTGDSPAGGGYPDQDLSDYTVDPVTHPNGPSRMFVTNIVVS